MTNDSKPLVALVTGANRGIGLETSRQLAAQGVTVLMAGRNADAIQSAAAKLREEGLNVEPVELDVGDDEQIDTTRQLIADRYGKLDILVNNAGIIADATGFMTNNATSVTRAELERTFDTNVYSVVAVTQAMLPLIRAAPAGRIVNVSSVMGSLTVQAMPEGEMVNLKPYAYTASKAALNMYTINLAQALADTPIKVNSAHPGWVKTDLGSQYAPMEIPDGAKTSVRLALLDADGPSGSFFHLDDVLPW